MKSSKVVRVSSKYQIAIPPSVRETAGIRPGAEFEVLVGDSQLVLVPLHPPAELRGRVKRDEGLTLRDKDDRR